MAYQTKTAPWEAEQKESNSRICGRLVGHREGVAMAGSQGGENVTERRLLRAEQNAKKMREWPMKREKANESRST